MASKCQHSVYIGGAKVKLTRYNVYAQTGDKILKVVSKTPQNENEIHYSDLLDGQKVTVYNSNNTELFYADIDPRALKGSRGRKAFDPEKIAENQSIEAARRYVAIHVLSHFADELDIEDDVSSAFVNYLSPTSRLKLLVQITQHESGSFVNLSYLRRNGLKNLDMSLQEVLKTIQGTKTTPTVRAYWNAVLQQPVTRKEFKKLPSKTRAQLALFNSDLSLKDIPVKDLEAALETEPELMASQIRTLLKRSPKTVKAAVGKANLNSYPNLKTAVTWSSVLQVQPQALELYVDGFTPLEADTILKHNPENFKENTTHYLELKLAGATPKEIRDLVTSGYTLPAALKIKEHNVTVEDLGYAKRIFGVTDVNQAAELTVKARKYGNWYRLWVDQTISPELAQDPSTDARALYEEAQRMKRTGFDTNEQKLVIEKGLSSEDMKKVFAAGYTTDEVATIINFGADPKNLVSLSQSANGKVLTKSVVFLYALRPYELRDVTPDQFMKRLARLYSVGFDDDIISNAFKHGRTLKLEQNFKVAPALTTELRNRQSDQIKDRTIKHRTPLWGPGSHTD